MFASHLIPPIVTIPPSYVPPTIRRDVSLFAGTKFIPTVVGGLAEPWVSLGRFIYDPADWLITDPPEMEVAVEAHLITPGQTANLELRDMTGGGAGAPMTNFTVFNTAHIPVVSGVLAYPAAQFEVFARLLDGVVPTDYLVVKNVYFRIYS